MNKSKETESNGNALTLGSSSSHCSSAALGSGFITSCWIEPWQNRRERETKRKIETNVEVQPFKTKTSCLCKRLLCAFADCSYISAAWRCKSFCQNAICCVIFILTAAHVHPALGDVPAALKGK